MHVLSRCALAFPAQTPASILHTYVKTCSRFSTNQRQHGVECRTCSAPAMSSKPSSKATACARPQLPGATPCDKTTPANKTISFMHQHTFAQSTATYQLCVSNHGNARMSMSTPTTHHSTPTQAHNKHTSSCKTHILLQLVATSSSQHLLDLPEPWLLLQHLRSLVSTGNSHNARRLARHAGNRLPKLLEVLD